MISRYAKADWGGFRSYIAEVLLSICFKNRAFITAYLITEWTFSDVDNFILKKTNGRQITSLGSHQNVLQPLATVTTTNHWKRVLENAMSSYALFAQVKVENKNCLPVISEQSRITRVSVNYYKWTCSYYILIWQSVFKWLLRKGVGVKWFSMWVVPGDTNNGLCNELADHCSTVNTFFLPTLLTNTSKLLDKRSFLLFFF